MSQTSATAKPENGLITGMGAALVDLFAAVSEDELTALGSPKASMSLIDAAQSTALQEKVSVDTHRPGGSIANSIAGMAALGMVLFTPLRKLVRPLLKQPGEGPSEEERNAGWFDCKFILETESGEKMVAAIRGDGDPGYKVTSKLVAECALCLVENGDDLPGGSTYGGVLTSASGLGMALVDRLSRSGIEFDEPRMA